MIINPRSMDALINLLGDKTGLRFECYRRSFIEKRVKSRLTQIRLNSDQEYYDYIKANPSEINKFLNDFTVNYTYFFRNIEIFQKIEELFTLTKKGRSHLTTKENQYLSKLSIYKKIQRSLNSVNKLGKLRIWSCACASGEEPYSLVMMLNQLKNKIDNFPDYEIIASDIDNKAIKAAEGGIFNEFSLRELTSQDKDEYFEKINRNQVDEYKIKEDIRKSVEFVEEDVTKGHVKNQKYDIIFCRYLLIYINKSYYDKLIKVLEDHMAKGGLLILGKTESISKRKSSFQLLDGNTQIYIKK